MRRCRRRAMPGRDGVISDRYGQQQILVWGCRMIRFATLTSLALAACVAPSFPTLAASFDCTKASTPFENAICENEDLSEADKRLARTYATASGGLSELALGVLR